MTQMLGLCSGNFDNSNPSTLNSSINKTSNNDNYNKVNRDSSSLNFHDDNANASFANFTFNQSGNGNRASPDDESTRTCGLF